MLNHRGTEITERNAGRKRCRVAALCALCLCGFLPACPGSDISVVATVDQKTVSFGESFVYTIEVKGTQGAVTANVPQIEGLQFSGPSHRSSAMIVNNQVTQSVQLQYAVTPARLGEFVIPSVEVQVGGRRFTTQPIKINVVKSALDEKLKQGLYARVRFDLPRVYVGQVAPVEVRLFVREDMPFRGASGFQCAGEGLGHKFLNEAKRGTQVIEGEKFAVFVIEGALSPVKPGNLAFGPCALQVQLQIDRRRRGGNPPFDDPFFSQFFGNTETREVAVATDPVAIEVLPLPVEGRPPDFAGAVGQWKLEVSAKPVEVAIGDPITLTARISGAGNIDTVPPIKLGELPDFKAYEPTSKTSKNDLGTQGEREFQQVLIARDVSANQLPEIRLSYFDPIARQYKIARHEPIRLAVHPGASGQTAIVGGGPRLKPSEKLGEDIVYLKGDLGPVAVATPFCATPAFLALNLGPVLALVGAVAWKRRADRLRADVAYARRSRAAKHARKLLAAATSHDQIQRALQSYLGDRLNVPASGITASIADEHLVPRGLNGDLASRVRACFEECDNARFAGSTGGNVDTTREKVEQLIDELEKTSL